jgi:membrane protease YdiL (CAAX protease family)
MRALFPRHLDRASLWDYFFLFLFVTGILLNLTYAGRLSSLNDSSPLTSSELIAKKSIEDTPSYKEEDIKKTSLLGLFMLFVIAAGLVVNIFLVIFAVIDRKGLADFFNFHRPRSDHCIYQGKDLVYIFIFGYFLFQVLRAVICGIKSSDYFSPGQKLLFSLLFGTIFLQGTIALFVMAYSLVRYKKMENYFAKTSGFFKNIFATSIIFLAALPWILLFVRLGITLSRLFNIPLIPHAMTDYLNQSRLDFNTIYLISYACIGAPLLEEFLFRGYLYNTLKSKIGFFRSLLLTSIIFSLFHMNFIQFFYIFGLGVSLVLVYESTRNLWYSIILHSANNIVAVILAFIFR